MSAKPAFPSSASLSVGSNTSSNDPKLLNSRVFIGNLPTEKVSRSEVEDKFSKFGKVLGVSLHKSYGFVQYDSEANAKKAVDATNGDIMGGNALDVNLAAKRRKESEAEKSKSKSSSSKTSKSSSSDSRSHHSSRHHDDHSHRDRDRDRSRDRDRPYRRRSRSPFDDYRARLRHMDRMHGYPPPPFRDPFFDLPPPRGDMFYYPPDDLYMRDPFPLSGRLRDPYGSGLPDPYDRMILPRDRDIRDPPLRDRDLRDREPRDRDLRDKDLRDRDLRDRDPKYDDLRAPRPRSFSPPRRSFAESLSAMSYGKGDKPTDMEIIVVNKLQKKYADTICERVKFIGLVVEMVNLSATVSLADALDAAANRGLLYAIIVTPQHELHCSVTLTILHGRNPQEHKNMPLEDALALVERDHYGYLRSVREGRIPPRRPKNDVSSLLSQVASGGQVSADQLQQVIDVLQKQKQQTNEPSLQTQAPLRSQIQLPPKDDIQRQQADLQAKILSLLGSSAVVPSSTNQRAPHPATRSSYDNNAANGRGGERLGGASGYRGGGGSGGGGGGGGMSGGGRGYNHGGYGSGY